MKSTYKKILVELVYSYGHQHRQKKGKAENLNQRCASILYSNDKLALGIKMILYSATT